MEEFAKRYLEILNTELKGLNLTRIDSFEDFYNKQIIDSIKPLELSKIYKETLSKTQLLIDVGFGGGFPLLPLAYNNPNSKFIGFEARGKKAKAVQMIADLLGLRNAKTFHQRIEDIVFDVQAVITLKAVGQVSDFLKLINHNNNVTVFFYKGPRFYELEDISEVLKNWEMIEELSYDIENTEGRLLVGFKPKSVLRGTKVKNKKNKSLVYLSQIL